MEAPSSSSFPKASAARVGWAVRALAGSMVGCSGPCTAQGRGAPPQLRLPSCRAFECCSWTMRTRWQVLRPPCRAPSSVTAVGPRSQLLTLARPAWPSSCSIPILQHLPHPNRPSATLAAVTAVSTCAAALSYLRTGVAAFDVVLAEVRGRSPRHGRDARLAAAGAGATRVSDLLHASGALLRALAPFPLYQPWPALPPAPPTPQAKVVAADEAMGRSFVDAFEDTPVVLMAAAAGHADVLRAVKMGAVDFLDKPLSLLKLKNIWQHSVRKVRGLPGRRRRRATQLGFFFGGRKACARRDRAGCQQLASVLASWVPGKLPMPSNSYQPALTPGSSAPTLPHYLRCCPQMMLKAAGPRGAAGSAPAVSASAAPSAAPTPTAILPVVAPVPPSAPAFAGWSGAAAPLSAAPAPSASTGPESPGTPAGSMDLPETFSVCSMEDTGGSVGGSVHGSVRGSFDAGSAPAPAPAVSEGFMDALNGALGGLQRNASYTSMPSQAAAAPLAHGGPAPAVWPALPTGCVWGTPFNGPVPPPLPGAAVAPSAAVAPMHAPVPAPAAAPAPAPAADPAPAPAPADWTDIVLPVSLSSSARFSEPGRLAGWLLVACPLHSHLVASGCWWPARCTATCMPSYPRSCLSSSCHASLRTCHPSFLLLPKQAAPPNQAVCPLRPSLHPPVPHHLRAASLHYCLQAAPEMPTLIKGGGSSAAMQPVPASTDALVLPEGFLTSGLNSGEPLGSFGAVQSSGSWCPPLCGWDEAGAASVHGAGRARVAIRCSAASPAQPAPCACKPRFLPCTRKPPPPPPYHISHPCPLHFP